MVRTSSMWLREVLEDNTQLAKEKDDMLQQIENYQLTISRLQERIRRLESEREGVKGKHEG